MALITKPSMTDDSGTFDNGTVVDEAFIDSIIDEVDLQTHSTTNPTVRPKAITDEVVTARGNLASLNARLSAVVDADGTPVPSASAVTQAEAAELPTTNCVLNETFIIWAAGDSAAPSGWTLAGTGAACARAGTSLADTTRKVGDFCAKLTFGTTALTLVQDVLPTAAFSRVNHLQGEPVGLGAWVWANAASQSRIFVTNGVTTTYSSYHTGDGTWQWLTVEHTLSGSATKLQVGISVESGAANPAYFSGPTLVFGDIAPANWRPTPCIESNVGWSLPSIQTTGTAKGTYLFSRMAIIKYLQATLQTAPTGATTFKIDVNKGGSTMLGSVITFTASDKAAAKSPDGTYAQYCFAGANVASGTTLTDQLSFDIDAVGSTVAGSDLTLIARFLEYADPFESVKAA